MPSQIRRIKRRNKTQICEELDQLLVEQNKNQTAAPQSPRSKLPLSQKQATAECTSSAEDSGRLENSSKNTTKKVFSNSTATQTSIESPQSSQEHNHHQQTTSSGRAIVSDEILSSSNGRRHEAPLTARQLTPLMKSTSKRNGN